MTPEEERIGTLAIAKHRAAHEMLFFTRYFFKARYSRKFVIGDHHRIISDALDKVISGEIKKLIINIAPRYGKTELAVKNFIAHGLAINPAARFIHLSYSDTLALDNSEEVKEIVKHEAYQEIFPHVQIKRGSDSKKKWYTTAGGGVYATSTAGQVTGFGAGSVDIEEEDILDSDREVLDLNFLVESKNIFSGALIIDDSIKPEDGDSEVRRERINQRYDNTIKNRVNSRNTPIIIVQQRTHEHDLPGYLIENNPGEWTVISLPCLKPDGTALWEFKHTVAELQAMEKDNEIVFGRQYQQTPQPLKGILFPKKELNYFEPSQILEDAFESSTGYVDVADEGSDHVAAPVGRNIGEKVYITDIVFNKMNMDTTVPLVGDLFVRHNVKMARVESNSMGAPFGRALRPLVPTAAIQLISSGTNKHTRILMQQQFIKKYCYFLPEHLQHDEYKAFMKELTSYMKEVKIQPKDDAPDSLAGLADLVWKRLNHYYKPKKEESN